MVKLTNPLNRGGVILEAGTVLNLGDEMEKALIKNKNAEAYKPEKAKEPEPPEKTGKEDK